MPMSLLQTKFYVPGLQGRDPHLSYVYRPQLYKRLDQGLGRRLTLLCAPAGFGKSTVLSEWIRQKAHDPPTPVAWLSLDPGDNDPVRFWSYVVAALQRVAPAIGLAAMALLQAPQPLSPEGLLTPLLNELAARSETMVLVLDDYHLITDPAIHKALLFVLDHLPPQLHLILSSRIDPPWPLARWRAQGQLAEVRAEDLRFTPDEAARFFQDRMGLDLSPAAITALERRTEGWIAGLQLAALSLQGVNDREHFIAAFSGSNRYIVDYLVEEVLSHQPAAVQAFLLRTSILERLCGPLCDAVLGQAEGSASVAGDGFTTAQTLLEQLDHANLFLIPLDAERHWYRYHHLFAEVLANRLRQTQRALQATLHSRASAWFEAHELWPEAIHHALAATDFVRAAQLIERVGIAHYAQPAIQHSLDRWLPSLPPTIIRQRPRLCLIYAWILFAQLDMAGALQRVAEAEAAWQQSNAQPADAATPPAQERQLAGEIAAMRAMLIAYTPTLSAAEAIVRGQQALALLAPAQTTFCALASLGLGMAYLRQGDVSNSEAILVEATRWSQAAENVYLFSVAASHQVAMQRARGALRLAQTTCHTALAWMAGRGALIYPTYGGIYLNLADLHREQNDLVAAQRYAEEAVAYSDQEVNPSLYLISRLALIRLKQAQGDWPQVWSLLQHVTALAEQHPTIIHPTLLPAMTAQFQLGAQFQLSEAVPLHAPTAGLKAALEWARKTPWEEGDLVGAYRFLDLIYQYEHSRVARAQIWIAWAYTTGDLAFLPETLAYLQRQQQVAERGGLCWFQIKLHLLQALAHHALADDAQSRLALTQALRLAHTESYLRIFLDEGEPLRRLLAAFGLWLDQQPPDEAWHPIQAYIAKLLPAFGPLPAAHTTTAPIGQTPHASRPTLVEPLSERELELLRLVHDGLSNSEIAERLIITVGTVKKHLNNIFGKLGVSSRTQAVVAARALRLL
jgi:LuxR family transcriptional regulator, maltose regulon positive regulatory protein